MEKIKQYVAENLPALCAELVEWRNTKILNKGVGGKVRELARMIKEYMGQDCNGLAFADQVISKAALEFVVRHHGRAT